MARIIGRDVMSVCIYVDEFKVAVDFYSHILGLEKSEDCGEDSCFFRLSDNPQAIYLEGGHVRVDHGAGATGVSFMLMVDSAPEAYEELREMGVTFVHDKPQDMGSGNYWFRFYDPAGNIIEIVSTPIPA